MPSDRYRTLPITFERGLIEQVEDDMLPPGSCAKCQNWVPDPSGNLRVRRGWSKGSTTSAPSVRKGWGIGHVPKSISPGVVQRASGTDPADTDPQTVSATWGSATTTGNLLVAKLFLTSQTSTQQPSAFTITPPSGYTLAASPEDTSSTVAVWIYYKANAASESGSKSFTVEHPTLVRTIALALELTEVSGCATSPLDQTANSFATATSTPASGTTATVTTSNGYAATAIVGSVSANAVFSNPTNSFVESGEWFVDNGFDDLNAVSHDKVYSNGGTQGHSVTSSDELEDAKGVIATFKASGSAASQGWYIVANNETPDIKIYYIDRDNVTAGTWTQIHSLVNMDAGVNPVAFTSGNGRLFYTHPNFTTSFSWTGIQGDPISAIASSIGARCLAWHKSRLFLGGGATDPTKLFYSEIGDHTIWSGGTAGSISVGQGDGEPIEDIAPFEDGLLIGKATSLWYLTGSGPGNFKLIRLPSSTGIAPGRTITPTPYGAMLAGTKRMQIFSGGSVREITSSVLDSYGLTGSWMTGAIVGENYYINDQGSGLTLALDLEEGVWHTEVLGTGNEVPQVVFNRDNTLLSSPKNASTSSILQFRNEPGSSRAKDFATLSTTYEAWTPEIWPVGPEEKITPLRLFVKVRQRNGDAADTVLTITPVYDGRTQTAATIPCNASAGVYWYHRNIGWEQGVSSVQFKFTQTVPDGDAVLFDIQEVVLGFDIEPVAGR